MNSSGEKIVLALGVLALLVVGYFLFVRGAGASKLAMVAAPNSSTGNIGQQVILNNPLPPVGSTTSLAGVLSRLK